MNQLALFPQAEPLDPEALRAYLARGLGAEVRLVITKNRTSVLTYKRAGDGTYEVRLQKVFLEAPDDVLNAVLGFVKRPTRVLREKVVSFFSSRPDATRREPRPAGEPAEVRAQGSFYDLEAILDGLNERYFQDAVRSAITWGDAGKSASGRHGRGPDGGRTIRFGSYLAERDLIRIHPTLDAEWVPRFFVEGIVFHEMLHAVIPITRDGRGRRCIHPPEFRKRERVFHAFEEAAAWERANLKRLLSARG